MTGRRIALCLALGLLGMTVASLPSIGQTAGHALVLEIDGAIGPATSDYLSRGLERATDGNAALVVVRIDTPGGLDTSMRDMIREILASPVPVATFVHPSGARAASAGTYILYASHIAAMAPGTNLGAATPVQIGGGGGLPFGGGGEDEPDADGEGGATDGEAEDEQPVPAQTPQNASEAKAINDAVAYIRSLADLRGRNADWAESAVREAASLSGNAALERDVVDVIARDVDDLLTRIDGTTVLVADTEKTLATAGLAIETYDPDWRTRLLAVIANPNVALIFMMIGIYGLIFEFMNPGALFPGTIGAIALLLGLYSLAILPINFAGIGLMLLGVVLMIGEAFMPSFGILGIGGAVAFVIGAAIMVDPGVPGFEMSWAVIGGVAVASLAFSLLVVRMAITSHRRKVVSGQEQLIGAQAVVKNWTSTEGYVFLHGERWHAVSDVPLSSGQPVRVTARDGLTLKVAPVADTKM